MKMENEIYSKALERSIYYEPLIENYEKYIIHNFNFDNLASTLFVPIKFYDISCCNDLVTLTEILDNLSNQYNSFLLKDISYLICYGEKTYIFKNSKTDTYRSGCKVAKLFLSDYVTKKQILRKEEQNEIYHRMFKIGFIGAMFGILVYTKS